MPGIVGFQGAADPQAAATLLGAMVEAMGVEEYYNIDSYVGEGVGLARIHLNIIDRTPQPLWSADGNIALVMTGEIFSWDGLALEQTPDREGT